MLIAFVVIVLQIGVNVQSVRMVTRFLMVNVGLVSILIAKHVLVLVQEGASAVLLVIILILLLISVNVVLKQPILMIIITISLNANVKFSPPIPDIFLF